MIRPLRIAAGVADVSRLFSLAMLIPIPVAMAYEAWDTSLFGVVAIPRNAFVFLASFALTSLVWLPVQILARRLADEDLLDREGYLTVSLGLVVVALFGTLPFLLARTFGPDPGPALLDAFVESMSGLTTTGYTVVPTLDAVAPSILVWRALLQWLGGLAIIVLTVGLLAKLTHGGLQLMPADAGGHSGRLKPKLAETARSLWLLYTAITGAFVALLFAVLYGHTGLGAKAAFLEALGHVLSGFSTGGFTMHDAGIAVFADPWVDATLALVMVAGATSFALTFPLLRRGQWRPFVRSAEVRFTAAVLAIALLIVLPLLRAGGADVPALGAAAFDVLSMLTNTGFVLGSHGGWPDGAVVVLLVLMLMGGHAGSTSGAIKSFRWLILAKVTRRELRRLLHPRAVIPIRMGNLIVRDTAISAVTAFVFLYLATWSLGTILLTATEPRLGLVDGSALAAGAVGNVVAGFGSAGALANPGLAGMLPSTKLIVAALMWLGRLEIFTALLLVFPASWRN